MVVVVSRAKPEGSSGMCWGARKSMSGRGPACAQFPVAQRGCWPDTPPRSCLLAPKPLAPCPLPRLSLGVGAMLMVCCSCGLSIP